ncbi:MAG: type II toxin-antitoxin system VapC family toxin [Gemmatales bacterium]
MRRYLFDTGILSDYVYRRHGLDKLANQCRLTGAIIGTTIPVVGELYYGAKAGNDPDKFIKQINHRLPALACWPYTKEALVIYGDIAAMLKRTGQPIQQVDIQTAAIALTLGNCTIVTTDSDFARIPGLSLENWRTP